MNLKRLVSWVLDELNNCQAIQNRAKTLPRALVFIKRENLTKRILQGPNYPRPSKVSRAITGGDFLELGHHVR